MLGAALSCVAPAAAAEAAAARDWTIEDMVEAPSVIDTALSRDGRELAYLLRRGDVRQNREIFELHLVSIAARRDQVMASSPWLGSLRVIPGQDAWSVLGDFGEGVQLYRFDRAGTRTTIVRQPDPILVGSADGAVTGMANDPPVRFGIASYAWRPDGRAIFYSALERKERKPAPLFDAAVVKASSRRRWEPDMDVRFYVRDESGSALAIASRPGTDVIARLLGGNAAWQGSTLYFSTADDQEHIGQIAHWRWTAADKVARPIEARAAALDGVPGPHGGILSVRGYGAERRIIESGAHGGSHDFGPFDGALSDPRSPGNWQSPDGSRALVAVRLLDSPRYALMLLTKDGRRRLYQANGSLTHCSFDAALRAGACIQQGLTVPPRIVSVNLKSGNIRPVTSIAPRYDALRRLNVEPRRWRSAMGYISSGFVIRPDRYQPQKRYPLVVITHGSDADERFLAADLVWNYPIQLLAQRGYVVVLVNDPSPSQSATLAQASAAWANCGEGMAPAQVQDLEWLSGVASYQAIVEKLVAEGTVDAARVGIAGYSRGAQMVNVAMTNARLFRAGSSGDGGYLEPAGWRYNRCTYRSVYGGGPGDPATAPLYQRLAPSYRAEKASGAVLQQMAEPRAGATDFYQSLREARVPAQITLYPGETKASDETHLFHIPANRMAAMRENLCWFDFWLRDASGSPADCPRIADWKKMEAGWRDRDAITQP